MPQIEIRRIGKRRFFVFRKRKIYIGNDVSHTEVQRYYKSLNLAFRKQAKKKKGKKTKKKQPRNLPDMSGLQTALQGDQPVPTRPWMPPGELARVDQAVDSARIELGKLE